MSRVVFWTSALLLVYVYVGYPALVFAWSRRRAPQPPALDADLAHVTVLVVGHNEAARVRARLENILALEYPRERLDVVFASDGSTDDTAERARDFIDRGVTVIAFETRRGKPTVLNDLVPKVAGDIVVLADARQRFSPGALRALVAPFANPRVGAVSGELVFAEDGVSDAGRAVGLYWRYEKGIRRSESRVDSTIGATGAIYAIRRRLFAPIPPDTILDDVLIPVRIVQAGYRVLFEPTAVAYDRVAGDAEEEFRRKVRTLAGNFQLLGREAWLIHPGRNRLWLQTMSHKGLRLLSPLLLASLFASTLVLVADGLYRLALSAQLMFYGAALLGWVSQRGRLRFPLAAVPFVFCVLNWATVVAFVRVLRGRQRVTWDRARQDR